jgi:hypothetical protein
MGVERDRATENPAACAAPGRNVLSVAPGEPQPAASGRRGLRDQGLNGLRIAVASFKSQMKKADARATFASSWRRRGRDRRAQLKFCQEGGAQRNCASTTWGPSSGTFDRHGRRRGKGMAAYDLEERTRSTLKTGEDVRNRVTGGALRPRSARWLQGYGTGTRAAARAGAGVYRSRAAARRRRAEVKAAPATGEKNRSTR